MIEKKVKRSITKKYQTIKPNWSSEQVKQWLIDMDISNLQNTLSSFNGRDLLLLSKTDIKLICGQDTTSCNTLISALNRQVNSSDDNRIDTNENKINFLVRYSNSNLYHLIELNELNLNNLQSKLQTLFGQIFNQINFQLNHFLFQINDKNIQKFIQNYKKYSLFAHKSSLVIVKDC